MITENFDKEKGFLIAHWTGECSLEEIVAYIRRTKENKDYPRKLKILTYAENAKLALDMDDLKTITEENVQSLANYEFIADAYIMDKAIIAAISSLYQQVSQVPRYFFKVFSSKEAAIDFLNFH